MIPALEISFEIAAPLDNAFDTWTRRINMWWPSDHTVSGAADSHIILEPRVGGRLYERTSNGVEHDWGRIVSWEPPSLFRYTWHLGRDATDATDVDITFTELDPSRTRVDIRHTGWERLGDGGQGWRDRNRGGWDSLLPHFIKTVEGNK